MKFYLLHARVWGFRIPLYTVYDIYTVILTYCDLLTSSKKKKRGQRTVGGDKSGRGLRQFSMKGLQPNPI